MNTKHTKGSWTVVEGRTHGSIEVFIGDTAAAEIWRRGDAQQEKAIAQRIVACVNACHGLTLDEIECMNILKERNDSNAEIVALKKERDEPLDLLSAIEQANETEGES